MEIVRLRSLRATALRVQDEFTTLHDLASAGDMEGRVLRDVEDLMRRYNMWAGNIGSLHDDTDPMSLEHRLRKVPKLRQLFAGLLEDMVSDLLDYKTRLENTVQREKSSGPVNFYEFSILTRALHSTITELYKASGIARQSAKIDRFANALARVAPCDTRTELDYRNHLLQLFPRLSVTEHQWLVQKLVKAHDARSRYLVYCEDHKRRTKLGSSRPIEEERELDSLSEARSSASTAEPGFSEFTRMYSDTVSESSAASSYGTTTAQDSRYDILDLSDLCDEEGSFVCPYCQQEQIYDKTDEGHKRRWRRHVFADLRVYVCTDISCGLKMFKTSHAWSHHQLSDHLLQWKCQYCNADFWNRARFEDHMTRTHGRIDDLEQWAKISESAVTQIPASRCSFCPYEEKIISATRRGNDEMKSSQINISVTPKKFHKHMSVHLEQIALGMLPTEYRSENSLEDDDSDSAHNLDDNAQNQAKLPMSPPTLDRGQQSEVSHDKCDEIRISPIGFTRDPSPWVLYQPSQSLDRWLSDPNLLAEKTFHLNGTRSEREPGSHQCKQCDESDAKPPARKPDFTSSQWFVPGDGISLAVITRDITKYLGNDATVQPGLSENLSVEGYWIKANFNLTQAMIQDLKADSSRLERENSRVRPPYPAPP